MRFKTSLAVALTLAPLLASNADGLNLGAIGPTFPIAEPHLLESIQQRLLEKQRSGELQRLDEEARRRAVTAINDPPPVPGLTTTQTARTFYYDPAFVLEQPILGERGQVLFPAGTRANPLEIVALSKALLFFDGRDPRQIAQARELMTGLGRPIKPILVGGSYLALMKNWREPVYFDQFGALTHRLGITHVPALVAQEGLRLRIDELVVR